MSGKTGMAKKPVDKSLLNKNAKFPPDALKGLIPLPVFLNPDCTYTAKELACAYAQKASQFLGNKYGINDPVYEFELGMFATNVEIYLMARHDVLTRGVYVECLSSSGTYSEKTNQSFPVLNKTQIAIEKFLDRFGMSPQSTLRDEAIANMGVITENSSTDFLSAPKK